MSNVIFFPDIGMESVFWRVLGESIAMNFESQNLQQKRRGVARAKRLSLRIDMTPMVDLGFLLVAFFVMTTQLSEPRVMRLNMPADGPPMGVPRSGAFTVLIDGPGRYFVYEGAANEPIAQQSFVAVNSLGEQGLRARIREFQSRLDNSSLAEGRNGMMMMVKPTKAATYQQIVDVLDETTINAVKKFIIVSADEADRALIRAHETN